MKKVFPFHSILPFLCRTNFSVNVLHKTHQRVESCHWISVAHSNLLASLSRRPRSICVFNEMLLIKEVWSKEMQKDLKGITAYEPCKKKKKKEAWRGEHLLVVCYAVAYIPHTSLINCTITIRGNCTCLSYFIDCSSVSSFMLFLCTSFGFYKLCFSDATAHTVHLQTKNVVFIFKKKSELVLHD